MTLQFFALALSALMIGTPSISFAVKAYPKPQAAPGRSKLPIASSKGGPQFEIKMRPAKGLAQTLPQKKQPAARLPANNEPLTSFGRILYVGWNGPTPTLARIFGLAVDGEYIVTTANAVADLWMTSGEVKFFTAGSNQPLTLVALDISSNVAVFSAGINARLAKSLPRQQLRFDAAVPGEQFAVLTSIGLVNGAKRVSGASESGLTRERFELSNTDLTDVGFVFDRAGRWVATLSPTEGPIFDGTPSANLQDVLRNIESKPLAPVSKSVLQSQASAWQDRWTTSYIEAARKGNALRALKCGAEAMKVEETAFASQLNRTRLVRCNNSVPLSLTRDYAMGAELVTGEVTFAGDVTAFVESDSTEQGLFAKAFFFPKRAIASVNLMTTPECEKMNVTNSNHKKVHVRFCTSALKTAQGLNDTMITVISGDNGSRATVSSLHLKGFDAKNSKRFMEWMIDSEAIR